MKIPSASLSTEPGRITAAEHVTALEELRQREPVFHRPEFGTTRAEFENVMDDAFWEIGASGRRYSREYVLDVLEARWRDPPLDRWEAHDFHCSQIAAGNYLLTYTLKQEDRLTRRTSIWRKTDVGWKIVFHQGTVVADA